jgi:eukaryotic translation initiation factor 2C
VTAKMIRYSATSTEQRKKKIHDLLRRIEYQNSDTIRSFGVQVEKKFESVEGRVIDPPTIEYRNRQTVRVDKGVWQLRRGEKFKEGGKVVPWGILNCDGYLRPPDVRNLKEMIKKEAAKHDILLGDPLEDSIDMSRSPNGQPERSLSVFKQQGAQFVVVIIIDRNDCYAKVKQAAELKVGILTQCIKSFTLQRKMNESTLGNIMLKVNAKLNGICHTLQEPSYNSQVNTMFVGGDVTHPSPDQRDIPSIVGVAASYDSTGFKYNCSWRIQDPREEMIQDFENIMVDHMNFYRAKNGQYPTKIFYYRDGVSEGQFQTVLDIEMTALKKACIRLRCNAKITFIVVQKRHHTRFFPDVKVGDGGRNNNVKAGTVVDKDIVHPHQYQFYLASHAAIQGVTKPTKYCVIYDENDVNVDDMEALSYSLCHLFTR